MGQANGKEKGDSGTQAVDGGELVPQGVYSGAQDYDHSVVKALIQSRKIAPFYQGLDDEASYAQAPYNTECPICFLYYPSPLNHTRCCGQPICTECFVQIKRADPTHTNPPSSEPAMCPYCQETDFGVVYKPPPPGVLTGENSKISAAGMGESASAAREQAEEIAEGSQQHKRRKSFNATDPKVVTIDTIRPDWQAKLMAAEAATLRRANRRIIMRQVGDRLIPVGVSSSRLGAELPPGSTTGPGGAIIIGENTRWGGERRGSRGRRGGDLAQFLQNLGGGGGPDMEEMMMMEAMRLSLLEHEEQQRRQAQSQSTEVQQQASGAAASTATENDGAISQGAATQSAPAAVPGSSILQEQQQATPLQPRSSSLASELASTTTPSTAPIPASNTNPALAVRSSGSQADYGISSRMMAELSELVEGGLSLPTSDPDEAVQNDGSIQHQPIEPSSLASPDTAAGGSEGAQASSAVPEPAPASIETRSASATLTEQFHSPSQSPVHTPTFGSPSSSRIGMNPNNPFRRNNAASTSTSPTHSRQHSSSAQQSPLPSFGYSTRANGSESHPTG